MAKAWKSGRDQIERGGDRNDRGDGRMGGKKREKDRSRGGDWRAD
jgi:hypothetical protein